LDFQKEADLLTKEADSSIKPSTKVAIHSCSWDTGDETGDSWDQFFSYSSEESKSLSKLTCNLKVIF
jgi:hypothetical protein